MATQQELQVARERLSTAQATARMLQEEARQKDLFAQQAQERFRNRQITRQEFERIDAERKRAQEAVKKYTEVETYERRVSILQAKEQRRKEGDLGKTRTSSQVGGETSTQTGQQPPQEQVSGLVLPQQRITSSGSVRVTPVTYLDSRGQPISAKEAADINRAARAEQQRLARQEARTITETKLQIGDTVYTKRVTPNAVGTADVELLAASFSGTVQAPLIRTTVRGPLGTAPIKTTTGEPYQNITYPTERRLRTETRKGVGRALAPTIKYSVETPKEGAQTFPTPVADAFFRGSERVENVPVVGTPASTLLRVGQGAAEFYERDPVRAKAITGTAGIAGISLAAGGAALLAIPKTSVAATTAFTTGSQALTIGGARGLGSALVQSTAAGVAAEPEAAGAAIGPTAAFLIGGGTVLRISDVVPRVTNVNLNRPPKTISGLPQGQAGIIETGTADIAFLGKTTRVPASQVTSISGKPTETILKTDLRIQGQKPIITETKGLRGLTKEGVEINYFNNRLTLTKTEEVVSPLRGQEQAGTRGLQISESVEITRTGVREPRVTSTFTEQQGDIILGETFPRSPRVRFDFEGFAREKGFLSRTTNRRGELSIGRSTNADLFGRVGSTSETAASSIVKTSTGVGGLTRLNINVPLPSQTRGLGFAPLILGGGIGTPQTPLGSLTEQRTLFSSQNNIIGNTQGRTGFESTSRELVNTDVFSGSTEGTISSSFTKTSTGTQTLTEPRPSTDSIPREFGGGTTPIPIPIIPLGGFNTSGGISDFNYKPGTRSKEDKRFYQPSITGISKGIKQTKGRRQRFTGLELRGI